MDTNDSKSFLCIFGVSVFVPSCFDTFTFAELNITIKYKCIFEKKSCSELTLTLVLNDYRLNQTATLLIGEPSQLEL